MYKSPTPIRVICMICVFWGVLLIPDISYAQNTDRPDWINIQLTSESGLFQYYRGESTGSDEAEVFRSALITAFERASSLRGGEISTKLKEVISNSGLEGMRSTELVAVPFWYKNASIVEHHTEIEIVDNHQEYTTFILLRIPSDVDSPISPRNPTYGFGPVWRSALLPGWGQRYKGETRKGIYILSSTLTAGAVTFISFYFSDSYARKAENERDIDNRRFYNDWSTRSHTMGIISGLIAGGLYGYNIFDALTNPGVKKYAHVAPNRNPNLLAYCDGSSARIGIKFSF